MDFPPCVWMSPTRLHTKTLVPGIGRPSQNAVVAMDYSILECPIRKKLLVLPAALCFVEFIL